MELKPPWLAPRCGFTVELQSRAEVAGEDRQRMGIRAAGPAGPVSRGCPHGGFQASRLSDSVVAFWSLMDLHDPGPLGCPAVGKDREGTIELVNEYV